MRPQAVPQAQGRGRGLGHGLGPSPRPAAKRKALGTLPTSGRPPVCPSGGPLWCAPASRWRLGPRRWALGGGPLGALIVMAPQGSPYSYIVPQRSEPGICFSLASLELFIECPGHCASAETLQQIPQRPTDRPTTVVVTAGPRLASIPITKLIYLSAFAAGGGGLARNGLFAEKAD